MSAEKPEPSPQRDPSWERVRKYKKITDKISRVNNAIMEVKRHLTDLERLKQETSGQDLPKETINSLNKQIAKTEKLIAGFTKARKYLELKGKPYEDFFTPKN